MTGPELRDALRASEGTRVRIRDGEKLFLVEDLMVRKAAGDTCLLDTSDPSKPPRRLKKQTT